MTSFETKMSAVVPTIEPKELLKALGDLCRCMDGKELRRCFQTLYLSSFRQCTHLPGVSIDTVLRGSRAFDPKKCTKEIKTNNLELITGTDLAGLRCALLHWLCAYVNTPRRVTITRLCLHVVVPQECCLTDTFRQKVMESVHAMWGKLLQLTNRHNRFNTIPLSVDVRMIPEDEMLYAYRPDSLPPGTGLVVLDLVFTSTHPRRLKALPESQASMHISYVDGRPGTSTLPTCVQQALCHASTDHKPQFVGCCGELHPCPGAVPGSGMVLDLCFEDAVDPSTPCNASAKRDVHFHSFADVHAWLTGQDQHRSRCFLLVTKNHTTSQWSPRLLTHAWYYRQQFPIVCKASTYQGNNQCALIPQDYADVLSFVLGILGVTSIKNKIPAEYHDTLEIGSSVLGLKKERQEGATLHGDADVRAHASKVCMPSVSRLQMHAHEDEEQQVHVCTFQNYKKNAGLAQRLLADGDCDDVVYLCPCPDDNATYGDLLIRTWPQDSSGRVAEKRLRALVTKLEKSVSWAGNQLCVNSMTMGEYTSMMCKSECT